MKLRTTVFLWMSLLVGAVLLATIFGWNYLLDWLGYIVHGTRETAATIGAAAARMVQAAWRRRKRCPVLQRRV